MIAPLLLASPVLEAAAVALGMVAPLIGLAAARARKANDERRLEIQGQIDALTARHAGDVAARDELVAQKDVQIDELNRRLEVAVQDMAGLKQDNGELRAEIANLKTGINQLQLMVGEFMKENKELKLENKEILKRYGEANEINKHLQIENRKANEASMQMMVEMMKMIKKDKPDDK